MGQLEQNKLVWWMLEDYAEHQNLTAEEIVEKSGFYSGDDGLQSCVNDLNELQLAELADCEEGRWAPTSFAEEERSGYLVIGVYAENDQRYADNFSAYSAEHAEEQAHAQAEEQGAELIVAGTVEFQVGTLDDMKIH